MQQIHVLYGRSRILLDLPSGFKDTSVGQLQELIEKKTNIPVAHQRLIHSGVLMKDASATLDVYHFETGDKLVVLGSAKSPVSSPPTRDPNQHSVVPRRTSHCTPNSSMAPGKHSSNADGDSSQSVPQVPTQSQANYLKDLQGLLANLPETQDMRISSDLSKSYAFIAESLMQTLLKIDGLVLPDEEGGSKGIARVARKEAVNRVQGLLEEADKVKEELEQLRQTKAPQ